MVRIPAFHVDGPGLIPGVGTNVSSPAAGAGDNLVVISGLDPPPAAEDLLGFTFISLRGEQINNETRI